MPENCFLCLNNTKNKICPRCSCSACPGCWGKYLMETTDVFTIIYPNKCSILMPYTTVCPVCKERIKNIKPLTRSDTLFGRQQAFMINIRDILFSLDATIDPLERREIIRKFFNMVVDNKVIVLKNTSFTNIIKNRLEYIYKEENFVEANIFHLRLFGSQIV